LATEADKEKFCDFLEGVEDDRLYLADFLTRKALDVGEEVIKKLGGNSNFGKFINDNLLELSIADTETKIKFLLNFRCNYKKIILCNRRFCDNPEYRNIYNSYKSESNAEITKFDQLMVRDEFKMFNTSTSTITEFNDALKSYLDRKGVVAYCMINLFLKQSKSNYV